MAIEMRPPEGFKTNALGAFPLGDGTMMRPNPATGWYELPETHGYLVNNFINQGWRLRSDRERQAEAERQSRQAREERERQVAAMTVDDILGHVKAQGCQIRVENGRIFVCGNPGAALVQVLRARQQDIVQHHQLSGEAWVEVLL